MLITESQLRKIIQEETQAVLHEQIIREFHEGILEEGIKDVLQGLVKKYGQKAVMAAVGASMALGTVGGAASQIPDFQSMQPRAQRTSEVPASSDMDIQLRNMRQHHETEAAKRAAREEAQDEIADQLVQTIDLTGDLGEREVDFTPLHGKLAWAKMAAAATGSGANLRSDWAWDTLEQALGPEAYGQLVVDAREGGAGSEAMQQVRGAVQAITNAMATMTNPPMVPTL